MSCLVHLPSLSIQLNLLKTSGSSEHTVIAQRIQALLTRLESSKDESEEFAHVHSRDDIKELYLAYVKIWKSIGKEVKVWPFAHLQTRKKLNQFEVKSLWAPEYAVQKLGTSYSES
jgi:hypothetical protein